MAAAQRAFAERHVVFCDVAAVDVEALKGALSHATVVSLQSTRDADIAQRYSDHAVACFERIQNILRAKPQGDVLFQLVASEPLMAGLSALLKTAALENPRFAGQVLLVSGNETADSLAAKLAAEARGNFEPVVRYAGDQREVLRWTEVPEQSAPVAIADSGVYLITGGLGALGILFANEILGRTRNASVVLTGRSAAPGPQWEQTFGRDERVHYRQLDLLDRDAVTQCVAAIQEAHGPLKGILHCAGMLADSFLLKKQASEFRDVLAPKVSGTLHLDEATRDLPLDFFVLFSSFAGAMGNVGQADYAAANGFLDQFAARRNRDVAAGRRHGRTRSINWSLWESGGMRLETAAREALERATGMRPLQSITGIDLFHRALAAPHDQLLATEGDLAHMRDALLGQPAAPAHTERPAQATVTVTGDHLEEAARDFLRQQFSGLLKLPANRIDADAALEKYGIDSILALKLTNQLEQTFGSLSKTLLFEYQTVGELARYLVDAHSAQLARLFASDAPAPAVPVEAVAETRVAARAKRAGRRFGHERTQEKAKDVEPIAIIGLSGRYPEAIDVEAYWRNLRDGKDCIVEVPKSRWDWRDYYSDDRNEAGRHYSKWGGFIEGVDEFDALFFNISPKEAKTIDQQERLFLQHVWMAIEDAG